MDIITHGLIAWLIARLWATRKIGGGAAVVAVISAVLPDIDLVRLLAALFALLHAPAPGLPAHEAASLAVAFKTFHAASHSLVVGFAYSLLAAAIANAVSTKKSYVTYFLVALLSFLADVLLDTLTPFGTEFLWPFWNRRFTGDLFWYVDPWISIVALLAVMFGFLERQGPRLSLWSLALVVSYLVACTALHQRALDRTRKEALDLHARHARIEALPVAFTPFVWKGYVMTPGTIYCYEWRGNSGTAAVFEAHTKALEDQWIQAAKKDPLVEAFCSEARFLSIRHAILDLQSSNPTHDLEFTDLQYSDRASRPHLVLRVKMDDRQNLLDLTLDITPQAEPLREEPH